MSKVVIKECKEYNIAEIIDKINSSMDLIGGWDQYVKSDMKVLLKVNLIGPKISESAAITHAEFVRAVVKILKSKQCEVWIGDSSGGAIAGVAPTANSFVVSGLKKVAEEEGAEIKNFDKEGIVEVETKSKFVDRMYLAKPLFDADLVINLPKFKTHSAGVFTGAVKNSFGCIPGLKKAEYHRLAPDPKLFGEIIADINEQIKIGLHIMDGIVAMQGEGPTAGSPYLAGKILVSTDPVALDTVASKMIGLNIEDVPILLSAKNRGLGEGDLNKIDLLGDYNSIPELNKFKLSKRMKAFKSSNYKFLVKLIDFMKTSPAINSKTCKKCNMCVDSCPVKAIDKESKAIDYSRCIECMCCHELCLYKAVELKRKNKLAGVLIKVFGGIFK